MISSDVTNPTAAALRRQYLRDVELIHLENGNPNPPIGTGSDYDIDATATANQVAVGIERVQIFDNDSNPLVAQGQPLDEQLTSRGLPVNAVSPARGKLRVYLTGGRLPAGATFQAGGVRGQTVRTLETFSGGVIAEAVITTPGASGNLPLGTKVRFSNQPSHVATEAVVSSAFVGGVETESVDRKRERLQLALQAPGGGNRAQKLLETYNADASISFACLYSALGGPSSEKIVIATNSTFGTRQASEDVIERVKTRIRAKFPRESNYTEVQSALDLPTDVALGLKLPTSGSGVWLATGPTKPTAIVSVSGSLLGIRHLDDTLPLVRSGDTLSVCSVVDFSVSTAEVIRVELDVGTQTANVTTGIWSGGYEPAVGDWIFPACEDLETILATWKERIGLLGPGENVALSSPRYVYARRFPDVTAESPYSLSSRQMGELTARISNLINADYLYVSPGKEPSVPLLASGRPSIITQRKFGIYPL